jgi:outer membrane immunogenic protein
MKTMISGAAVATLFLTPALAADMAFKAPPPSPAPVYGWTGFYAGVNAGYQFGILKDGVSYLPTPAAFGNPPYAISTKANGWLGGIQLGYNYQIQQTVLGLEADFDGGRITGALPVVAPVPGAILAGSVATAQGVLDGLGTVRGRVGYLVTNRLMLFASGGLAYGEFKTTSNTNFPGFGPAFNYVQQDSVWRAGWTVGGGAEWALLNNWTAKIEYLFYDIENNTVAQPLAPNPPFAVTGHWTMQGDTVRAGVNYKFN